MKSKLEMNIPDGSTVLDLCKTLVERFQLTQDLLTGEHTGNTQSFANFIVVNRKLACPIDVLNNEDKVTILPIISGG